MKTKEEKPVVIYNRIAALEQDSNKLAEQEEKLIAFAEKNGYKPVAVYSDVVSGITHPFKRQGFKELVKHVEDSKPVAVIVSDYARIGRKMDCFLSVHMWLQVNGIKLIATYSPEGGLK